MVHKRRTDWYYRLVIRPLSPPPKNAWLHPQNCDLCFASLSCLVIDVLSDLHMTEFPHLLSELIPPGACNLLNSSTIYANNEVNLAEVDIYGFDYDYTLALYSNALNTMIYNKARDFLIEHFKVCFTVVALIILALQLLLDSG